MAISVPPGTRCEPRIEARPGREKPGIAAFFLADCADQIDDRRPGQEGKTEHGDAGRQGDAAGDGGKFGNLLKQGGGGAWDLEDGALEAPGRPKSDMPRLVSWVTSGLYRKYE